MAVERTLSIIKPDATKRNLTGKINAKFEDAGLRIVAQKRIHLTPAQAGVFYAVHAERPFYGELCEFMASEPVVVQVLEGEGAGWQVALTTLMQERSSVGAGRTSPAHLAQARLRQLIHHLAKGDDPVVRQRYAAIVTRSAVSQWFQQRALASGDEPGPELSIAKLHFTALLTEIGDLAADLLGPALAADTGAWGTFAWSQFVTGAPGMHLAGGTGQIQRTILAERVLGLPR